MKEKDELTCDGHWAHMNEKYKTEQKQHRT